MIVSLLLSGNTFEIHPMTLPFKPSSILAYLFLLVPFAISMPGHASSVAVLSISVVCLYLLFTSSKKGETLVFLKSPAMILIGMQFLVVVLGLAYSPNIEQGWEDVERSFFLLAAGLILYQMKSLEVSVFHCIITFAIGCAAITLVGIANGFPGLLEAILQNGFQHDHGSFTESIDIHPTYLTIYFTFIFFFLAETMRIGAPGRKTYFSVGLFLAGLFCVAIILLLRSKMGLLVFATLLVIYAIIILKRRAWLVTFVLFTIGLLTFLLDQNRITTIFDTYGQNVSAALDQRFMVWRGTLEGIKTSPIFGAGTGGEQLLIDEGYRLMGFPAGITNSFNAHNQYLQFFVRNGILELGFFLAFLIYCFKKSRLMNNYTFLLFNMAVTLIMFTESFLSVQKGIMFFYFFSLAFLILPYQRQEPAIREI